MVTEGGAKTGPVSLVLVSNDGGNSFLQYDPPTLFGDWKTAFVSATNGVIIGNANSRTGDAIYSTEDGGSSWNPARLPGYGSAFPAESSLGTPVVDGSRIYVTANTPANGGDRQISLYAGNDGGTTFALEDSATIPDPTDLAAPVLAISGRNVWMVPSSGGSIIESSDGGATWSDMPASGLSGAVVSVGLSGGDIATAWVISSSCPAFKTDCSSSTGLFATKNGGHSWTRAPLPTSS